MESRDWLNEYKALKQVGKTNPFSVPAGYFDDLGDRIMANKYFSELKDSVSESGFLFPENYFGELDGHIQSRINIEAILTIENPGFTVPENYFEELAGSIKSRVDIAAVLENGNTGFVIPENYFENLEQHIESRIFLEEALGDPVADFTVPDNYFAGLTADILNKTVNQQEAVVKKIANNRIVRKLYQTTAFKYATAACFALAIGGGILISQLTNPVYVHKHSFLHKELSGVPIDDIKSYLQLNVDAGDAQQTVISQDAPVNDETLKKALQNDIDSVQ